jgi:chromosome segregation ATPase
MPEGPVHVAHALCVYAEPLAARRRVVVVGDATLGLDARLVALGARTVHVFDPDGERARAHLAQAPRGVIVRELPKGEIDVREGAFDLAIVPDLAMIEDRAGLLTRLRRLVGPEGAALVAARSAPPGDATGLDYYEMYDLVSLQFASVRMVAQVPFVGVTLAELGDLDEEPAVSVDTQLAGESGAPELFVAVASQREARLEPYAIVQLPRESVVAAPAAEETRAGQAELAAAILRSDLLQAQLEEQRGLVTRLRAQAEHAPKVDELEAMLHERATKLKDAETRAGDHYVRAERLGHDVRRLEEELQRQRDRAARLTKELEDEKRVRTRAEVDLGMVRKNPELAAARERIALLEDGLRTAEEATAVLQARVIEAEKAIAAREAELRAFAEEIAPLREIASMPRIDPERAQAWLARAEQAEARAALLEAQVAELAEGHGAELAELEVVLRQRGGAIAALERELIRREGIVRELVAALEENREHGEPGEHGPSAQATQALAAEIDGLQGHLRKVVDENAELRAKLDALALEVARREGELQARTWRIAELEERVASLEARPPEPAAPAREEAAHTELGALRQALAQEHEARVRAESGEELTRARADLARQAALLEQLSRELEARAPGQSADRVQP